MCKSFDFKPKFSIEYQAGIGNNGIIHIGRYQWDDHPVADSKITTSQSNRHDHVTRASYERIARLVNHLIDKEMGSIRFWLNCPGSWTYRSYGDPIQEAPNVS